MSDADRVSEIRARLDAATAGEWNYFTPNPRTNPSFNVVFSEGLSDLARSSDIAEGLSQRDAEFIAAAPSDIAFLLAEVSRLSTVIEDAAAVQHAESRERRHREIDLVVEMLTKHDLAQATQYPAYRVGNRHETAEMVLSLVYNDVAFLLAEVSREKLDMRTEQTAAAEAETRKYRAEVSRLSTVIEETSKRLESILGSPYNEYDRIPAWASGYLRELKDALSVPVSPKEKN